ncbi:elongation factor 1-alpha putativehsp70 subfamily B suppressor 1 [Leptomonas pyrrhocoris]|uniref:Elongation factor 1-alpha putativehsp70 subfamily B suppressor 1 n=1 Tax=Leptomonas pyrrhocoris TaxID=157538 RepID=A0A0N0E0J1_LEPPY|nr:elongation factor 1-alpha putativehsp70 subfamily B suppressor 1 [Leptomonas pyrrhocoris]KPA86505.1 elongation factor 1-alpha putativehsp70 subfamily B suppressor 1 [Leptomonas pyrrhocoris]|eukprot:XP_015664944.1 elongation factor 1-alpha putativehsp70 subfamily B suppressor 1 [Leptomonas pyrrhocoris]
MNRHNKFYAEMAGELEEDDYNYDEEDYNYDEEYEGEYEGEYEEGEGKDTTGTSPPAARVAESGKTGAAAVTAHTNPFATISPQSDGDYDVLEVAIPQLYASWKVNAPTMLPLTEAEAVTALRASNYDLGPTVLQLKAKRDEQRTRRGGGGVLKVAAAPGKATVTTVAAVESEASRLKKHSETDEEENGLVDSNHSPGASSYRTAGSLRGSKGTSQRRTKQMLQMEPDLSKPDCTFVVAGHVDAGKSTTLGHLLLLLGRVSMDEVTKNEKAGRSQHKESFKYAWLLDQSEEERRRGVTIDAGSFGFETAHRRVHVLDAPGHKDFVLNMISSATQADAALLVVNAATSEFETGLQHGTKEHLLVLKTLGVGSIVVAVNKMDSVGYSKDRYDYIVRELQLLLKQTRIPDEAIIGFCPISGMTGANICELDKAAAPWYSGPCLLEMIDQCPLESRLVSGPLRLSLQDVQGTTLYAKVESGKLFTGDNIVFVPSDVRIAVKAVQKPTVAGSVLVAFAGEPVEIVTNSSVTGLYPGCVGCDPNALIRSSIDFEAQIQTFRTLTRAILPGSTFTVVVHALTVQVRVIALISRLDAKTGSWSKGMVKCVPPATQAMVLFRAETPVALEPATECRALGRFVLQQDGDTVAGGLVMRVMGK